MADKVVVKIDGDDSGFKKTLGGIGSVVKTGLATVTAGVAAVSTALVKGVSDTAAYGDNVDKMSQKIGMSAESFQKWDYVLGLNGASVDSLQMVMKTLSNAAVDNKDEFQKLGISQEELQNSSPEELFEKTITALQGMEASTERTAIASTLLGKGATELAPLLNQTAEATEAAKKQAEDYGLIMSDDAVKASAAFQDSLATLQGTITGLRNRLMSEFLPSITQVTDGLAKLFTGDMSGLDDINAGITEFVDNISQAIPQMLEIGGSILSALAGAILDNLPMLIDSSVAIILQLVQGLIEALPQIVEAGMQMLTSIITGIANAIPELIPTIISVIETIIMTLVENLPLIITAGLDLLMALIEGIVNAIPQLVAMLPTIIDAILNFITENLPTIIDSGIKILLALIDGLIKTIPQLLGMLPQIIDTIINFIFTNLPVIIDAGIKILLALINGIVNAIPQLVAAIPQVIMGVVNGIINNLPTIIAAAPKIIIAIISGLISAIPQLIGAIPQIISAIIDTLMNTNWLEVGYNIIQGILNGFLNVGQLIWNTVCSFGNSVLGAIKSFFGIASPAKKMKPFGKFIGQGTVVGFEDTTDEFVGAVEDQGKEVEDAYKKMDLADMAINAFGGSTGITAQLNASVGSSPAVSSAVQNSVNVSSAPVNVQIENVVKLDEKEMARELAEPIGVELAWMT